MATARLPTVQATYWTGMNMSGGPCTVGSKLNMFEQVWGSGAWEARAGGRFPVW